MPANQKRTFVESLVVLLTSRRLRAQHTGKLRMIYLLRHGETLWNTEGRFQGQKDSPLTARGMEQADYVANLLAWDIAGREELFQIHVSPLGRALETAARVRRAIPLPVKEEPRLMEVTMGSWDGMTNDEIDSEHPGVLDGTDAFDWYFRSPDGETFDSACARARAWIRDVSSPTIAVSHGLIGRLLRGVYLGLTARETLELPVPQNGFYRLDDGQAKLVGGDETQSVRSDVIHHLNAS